VARCADDYKETKGEKRHDENNQNNIEPNGNVVVVVIFRISMTNHMDNSRTLY